MTLKEGHLIDKTHLCKHISYKKEQCGTRLIIHWMKKKERYSREKEFIFKKCLINA